jgi:hypothetical protein
MKDPGKKVFRKEKEKMFNNIDAQKYLRRLKIKGTKNLF